jgi:hypothetical protein
MEDTPDRHELDALWSEITARDAGYLDRPLPDPLDLALGGVVERFSDGGEGTREATREYEKELIVLLPLSAGRSAYTRTTPRMSRAEVEELQRWIDG